MKTHLLLCMGVLLATTLFAQVDGPRSPGTVTTSALPGAKKTWKNLDNVASSDNAYADFDLGGGPGNYSDYLIATNFGFSVPLGSIISGIMVEVERSDTKSNMSDYSIRIVKGGVIGSGDQSRGTDFRVADSYESFGGIYDQWGEGWTVNDINSSDFGVAIATQENTGFGGSSGRIDHIRITVFFEAAKTLPLKLISFIANKNYNNSVLLKWTTSEESNMSHYDLERSADGRNFSAINTTASRNSTSPTTYSFTDNDPGNTISYYRLKMAGTNVTDVKYSAIVTVRFNSATSVNLWPALLASGQTVNISNPANEKLTIRFFNNSGQQVGVITTKTNQFSSQPLSSQKGTVLYKVTKENGDIAGTGKLFLQ